MGKTTPASAGLLILVLTLGSAMGEAQGEAQGTGIGVYLEQMSDTGYLDLTDTSTSSQSSAYRVPLGAMQKIRGVWQPESSERLRAYVAAYTWRVLDGFASSDVLDNVDVFVTGLADAETLYSCDGRECGSSAQWANLIFSQRLLYGRAETQRYRAYSLRQDGQEYRILVYASARSADRQYLHAELLRLVEP